MTTEFEELELNKDVTSITEDEAKKTLSEFMEAHKSNRSAYDELKNKLDDKESEFEEKLEEKEERIAEFKQERAEEAAEYVNIPAELVAERFSFSEIEQIVEEGEEFSESAEDEEEDEEDEYLTTFSEKPEKGRTESGGPSKYRERAEQKLADHGIPVGDD